MSKSIGFVRIEDYEGCSPETHILVPYRDAVFVLERDGGMASLAYVGAMNYLDWCAEQMGLGARDEVDAETQEMMAAVESVLADLYESVVSGEEIEE